MNKKDSSKNIQDKAKKLYDSMDVIRARSRTWKDEPVYYKEIIANLDELEIAIKDLKKEIKSGKK
ncbi:MAG: hypothetical protein WA102_11580 [Candidatus Methanoperedens sp.]